MTSNIGILDPDGKNLNPLNQQPYSDEYKELAKKWKSYPAYENAKDIIKTIKDNQVVLITSGTGSGKTVLIPKYVLHQSDYKGKIMISLPKQITAQLAGEFAAKTLDVKLGEQVGYKFKGSEKQFEGSNPNLLYATDGTIVAKLISDPLLKDYDAVIIDEAHERKVQIDFMLYLLKNVVINRKDFKLCIMSATVNSEIFSSYFATTKFEAIDIGGKTNFPIESIFRSEPTSATEYVTVGMEILTKLLDKKESGKISDIIFFVTSINETFDVCKRIKAKYPSIECIEVYSGMDPAKQKAIEHKEGENQRVLVSTNVAESSVTVDGIKYVIDSGYELLSYYDPDKRGKVLEKKLITQAQAKQRMGRGGRTAPGICYHLYTKNDFENLMKKYPEPAIRLSNITTETLRLLSIETIQTTEEVIKVLGSMIEPPREIYIRLALRNLLSLELIESNKITKLGLLIANLQLDPEQGLALYWAYNLNVIREVLAIIVFADQIKNNLGEIFLAATDIIKDPTKYEQQKALNEKIKEVKEKLAHKYGDHLTLLKIFSKISKYEDDNEKLKKICYENYIKFNVIIKVLSAYNKLKYKIRHQIRDYLEANPELKVNLEIEDKIELKVLLAFKKGYKMNIATFRETIGKYRTPYAENINLSKESTLEQNKSNSEVIYNELFITKSNLELTIASTIPNALKNI
jgi:pre-mRNA-splicing factor ATP-dependent RNA helicase DHX15/PRP43